MDTTSASNVVPGYDALDSIDICIRNLKLLQDIILLREETPMDVKQHKVVMDQIKLLEELSKNAYESMKVADPVVPMPGLSPAETKQSAEQFNVVLRYDALDSIQVSIRNLYLLRNIILLRGETPMDEKQRVSVINQIKVLVKVSENVCRSMKDADPDAKQQGTTVSESETKEPRYLYLGDGLVICCLKLEQSYGNVDKIPSLPKIATLNLMDEGFPIASGLLKLGSDAYLIGGHDLPPCYLETLNETRNFPCEHSKPCGSELYTYITLDHEVRGTSCFTYRLSRLEAGRIVIVKEDILALNDPKIWPVIEKTDDGRLHVINSNPPLYSRCTDANTEMTFHEVLNPDDELGQKGWTRIPTTDAIREMDIVKLHLAVGNPIYSTTVIGDYMMFDFSNINGKWEACLIREEHKPCDPFCVEHVVQILEFGSGMCVRNILLPSKEGPLFIVIAVVTDRYDMHARFPYPPHVVAYLVSPSGRVLCFQRLPHNIWRFKPDDYRDSTVIRVDEQGKMMCAILHGLATNNLYLFISMFTVEVLDDSASKVAQLLLNDSAAASKVAVELEFVQVVVKERYVFETDSDADFYTLARLQACFI